MSRVPQAASLSAWTTGRSQRNPELRHSQVLHWHLQPRRRTVLDEETSASGSFYTCYTQTHGFPTTHKYFCHVHYHHLWRTCAGQRLAPSRPGTRWRWQSHWRWRWRWWRCLCVRWRWQSRGHCWSSTPSPEETSWLRRWSTSQLVVEGQNQPRFTGCSCWKIKLLTMALFLNTRQSDQNLTDFSVIAASHNVLSIRWIRQAGHVVKVTLLLEDVGLALPLPHQQLTLSWNHHQRPDLNKHLHFRGEAPVGKRQVTWATEADPVARAVDRHRADPLVRQTKNKDLWVTRHHWRAGIGAMLTSASEWGWIPAARAGGRFRRRNQWPGCEMICGMQQRSGC